jgi:hypothetical protein
MNPGWGLVRSWRTLGVTAVVLAGAAFFAFWVQRFIPFQHWLAWRYGLYWLLTAMLGLSCLSVGNLTLRGLLGRYLRFDEHLVLSVALGVLVFALSWFLLGLVGSFSAWTFCLLPCLCLALGARALWAWLSRYRRHGRLRRRGLPGHLPGWLRGPVSGFGVLALGLLYAGILTPDNIAYDARWYHLAAAEQYAVQGGIRPFADGWFVGAYPQLATWLYSWAFLLPTGRFFDHVELASHLEFGAFLLTLFGIPVLVRRILGGGGYGWSWVARLLFPGVFLYDSGLSGGADHIAAFWAIPIFLAFLRAYERVELRRCTVLTACLAGALLTKYSALSLTLFPAAAMFFRALQLVVRRRKEPGALGPLANLLAMLGLGLSLTAAHWLKNWVWYHDPVYPLAYDFFSPRPWTVDTKDRFGHFMPPEWSAPHSLRGIGDTLSAMIDFSFVPHDWPQFHGQVPVFGSLFTLAIPCLLFVRPRRRLLALFASCELGVGVWYWMFHQDRYLQTLLPWMAVCTASVGIAAWRLGVLPRLALCLLVGLQLAWGGDTPFIPAHALAGGTPFKPAIDLLSSSYRQDFKARFLAYEPLGKIKPHVAAEGTVMLHEMHMHLGIGVPTVSDWIGWQGGVSYVRTAKPSELYAVLRGMGVTDVLWTRTSRAYDSVGGDLAFYNFVVRHTAHTEKVGGFSISRLTDAVPSDEGFANLALYLGCGDSYQSGVYRLSDLSITVLPQPRPVADYPQPLTSLTPDSLRDDLLRQVDAVAVNPTCFHVPALDSFGLSQVAQRDALQLWVRTPSVVRRSKHRSP